MEEMNNQKEENAAHTEFTKRFESFVKEMRGNMDTQKDSKKAFVVLSIDKSVENESGLLSAVVGDGKLIVELIVRSMHANDDFRRILESCVKANTIFSMLKGLATL